MNLYSEKEIQYGMFFSKIYSKENLQIVLSFLNIFQLDEGAAETFPVLIY